MFARLVQSKELNKNQKFERTEYTMNIMIVGVGGQGTLLASRIIGAATLATGADVKLSEVHGMSQRGGSVVTYVKYGEDIASPVIDKGEADVILAFEKLEALRSVPFLKNGGTLIVNTQETNPMPVITGAAEYPENIIEKIENMGVNVIACDALALAKEAGNLKSVNVALIGVLAKHSNIEKNIWLDALSETVKPQFLEVNEKAFCLGYEL
ncbi:MAG: indolepyruvate oxidoreductase subunit beta [Ruminococcaceae bacterium]|nr:indolepyruvate oxidoreductase subunit beta [Oscillospiraceae bacterium]